MGSSMRFGVLVACLCLASLAVADVNTMWPFPQDLVVGPRSQTVSSGFVFKADCQKDAILDGAFQRYYKYTFWNGNPTTTPSASTLNGLSVCFTQPVSSTPLQLDMDESYVLHIDGASAFATLNASTVWGALRGLETFAQAVDFDQSNPGAPAVYQVPSLPITVTDKPRFTWRGLLVDSARHFLTVPAILRQIDALEASKMNTLHWHLVDAQSFPYSVAKYPILAQKGSYYPTAFYSRADIKKVVDYAKARGVRVVAEFDVPGHAASWGFGMKDIVADCPRLAKNINNIPLSPASNRTLDVLNAVLTQAASDFFDNFLHIGGDEVVTSCWTQDPVVAAWMKANNLDTNGVYQYFIDHAAKDVINLGRIPVQWQEVLDSGLTLNPKTIVHVWSDRSTLQKSIVKGFRSILSSGYYLDKQIPDPSQTWYQEVDTWKNFYNNDPTKGLNVTPEQMARVIGGEAAMWSETVNDANIDSKIWPRACAVGERLWSPDYVSDISAATLRLAAQSCRLMRRGIGAGPITPDFCLMPYY